MGEHFSADIDAEIAIGLGTVDGVSNWFMFGAFNNFQQDVERDLTWLPVTSSIPLPAIAGESLEIVSSDAADVGTVIEIDALGPDAVELETFTVELNGTTPVALPGSISRINQADSVDPDGFAGTVTIRGAGGGTAYALMRPEDQQMNQALYTVPTGKKWNVALLIATIQRSQGSDNDARVSVRFKGVNQTRWRRPFTFGAQRSGNSSVDLHNRYPTMANGPVDIKLSAVSSVNGTSVSGWASGVLVDYTEPAG